MIEFYLSQKAEVSKISKNKSLNILFINKILQFRLIYLFSQILKDIELFYSLPHQRRRTDWFLISCKINY